RIKAALLLCLMAAAALTASEAWRTLKVEKGRGIPGDVYEKIISENAEAHKKIAEALLEYETLDGVHVKEILEHGEIRTSVEYKPLSAVKNGDEEEKEGENKPEKVPATGQTEASSAESMPESKP
ncbi:MAG: hypothetical protein IJY80_04115, partial [Opitutales bacterium]|nr:hypothetical protein [Opitutales bacterium]